MTIWAPEPRATCIVPTIRSITPGSLSRRCTAADPAAIYRFKNEFRSLTDVNHPNLVQLYELLLDDQRWFFTMELVEGRDFLDHCRGHPVTDPEIPPAAVDDPDGLREIARQLATGLSALHDAGKLHCDIKPSNIRVAHDGRVVLLDFGLVQELFPTHGDLTVDAELAGTPAYMSPEQAAGSRLTVASDWYSVGVVLYEALTGHRPTAAAFSRCYRRNRSRIRPRSASSRGPALDLVKLVDRLLRRDPEHRPIGASVLHLLGDRSARSVRSLASHRSTSGAGTPFIAAGRASDNP